MTDFDYQLTANIISGGIVPDWQWAAGITFPFENGLEIDMNASANGEFVLPI